MDNSGLESKNLPKGFCSACLKASVAGLSSSENPGSWNKILERLFYFLDLNCLPLLDVHVESLSNDDVLGAVSL